MNYKKYLSGVLAAAMVLNTGAVSVLAAGTDTSVQEASQTQTSSTPETVYVNSYDGKERSVSFNDHWRFYLGELNGAEAVSYNDSSWDDVTLPHDYSIRDFQQQHRQSRRAAMCLEAPDGTAKVLHWMRACRERRSALILTVFT